MSGRVVAILLCVLVLLFGAVVLTKPKGPANAVGGTATRLVDAPPSQIGRIEVREQTGEFVRVGASESWPGWLVEWGTGDAPEGAWPASETTRVSGARILSTTFMHDGPEADLRDASELVIFGTDGSVLQALDVGSTPLAGQLPVRVAGTKKWQAVGREIGDFLKTDALLMWRDPAALPGLDASAVSIALGHNDEVTLRLRRVGNSWSLDYPVRASADQDAVLGLLEALIGMRSAQFANGTVGDDMLTVTIDMPASNDVGTRQYVMLLDAESGIGDVMLSTKGDEGTNQIARATLELSSSDTGLLTEIEATEFISKTVLQVPASEIAAFTMRIENESVERTSSRSGGGWESTGIHGHEESWCALLTTRTADTIQIGDVESQPFCTLTAEQFGGLTLGTFRLAASAETLWIIEDTIWRGFTLSDQELEELGIGLDG